MKILAIGAHPDDIELGCGGLLLKASRIGHEIYLYILTRGEAGYNKESRGENREEEAKRAAEILDAKNLWFGEFKDTTLMPCGLLVDSIEDVVNRVNPNLVLTHSIGDEHHDHRAVASTTIEAARYIPNILTYENPLTKLFLPQIFVDISEVIEDKIRIINTYVSQRQKDYLRSHAIFGLAQYRALQSRLVDVKFAEAFQIVKLKLIADHLFF